MLADYAPVTTLAVQDLERARGFYEGLLGFSPKMEFAGGVLYASGSTAFMVYPSAFAGTNKATAMSYAVPLDAFAAEVQALRDKGIDFLTFELEGSTWDAGVASTGGDDRSVWFEDPDGNILNLVTMEPV